MSHLERPLPIEEVQLSEEAHWRWLQRYNEAISQLESARVPKIPQEQARVDSSGWVLTLFVPVPFGSGEVSMEFTFPDWSRVGSIVPLKSYTSESASSRFQ